MMDEMRAFAETRVQRLRCAIVVNYGLQVAAGMAGAMALYIAVDNALTGRYCWAAVDAVLAWLNYKTFVDNALSRRRSHRLIGEWMRIGFRQ